MGEIDRRSDRGGGLSRRQVLAGGAGLGAVGMVAAVPRVAAADTAPAAPPGGPGPFAMGEADALPALGGAASLPVPVPGTTMRTIHALGFQPAALSSGASLVGVISPAYGAYNSASQALVGVLDIPPGGVLKQVDCYAYATNSTPPVGTWSVLRYNTQGGTATVVSITPPTGPGLTQHTFAGLSAQVDGTDQLVANLSASNATYYAVAVTYQYLPVNSGALNLVGTPVRVYDSRLGFPPATGTKAPMTNGETRAVSCAFGGAVPAGASAALVNLTVTGTSAAGFLAAFRNGISWPGNSSVNWDHVGQTIANQAVVALDGTANLALYCAGQTDVVVDVIGYYV